MARGWGELTEAGTADWGGGGLEGVGEVVEVVGVVVLVVVVVEGEVDVTDRFSIPCATSYTIGQ